MESNQNISASKRKIELELEKLQDSLEEMQQAQSVVSGTIYCILSDILNGLSGYLLCPKASTH